jgi:hypothetical protein
LSKERKGEAVPDIITDHLVVEVKDRARLPRWLLRGLAQARAYEGGKRLPILIAHERGQRHDNDLVVIAFKDFIEYFGTFKGALKNVREHMEEFREGSEGDGE